MDSKTILYQLGDEARSCDMVVQSPGFSFIFASTLKKGDTVFVQRSDGTWRYAVVARKLLDDEPRLEFFVDDVGSIKILSYWHWSGLIRGIKPRVDSNSELLEAEVNRLAEGVLNGSNIRAKGQDRSNVPKKEGKKNHKGMMYLKGGIHQSKTAFDAAAAVDLNLGSEQRSEVVMVEKTKKSSAGQIDYKRCFAGVSIAKPQKASEAKASFTCGDRFVGPRSRVKKRPSYWKAPNVQALFDKVMEKRRSSVFDRATEGRRSSLFDRVMDRRRSSVAPSGLL